MFYNAFPESLRADIDIVLKQLPNKTMGNVSGATSDNVIPYKLDDCIIEIPYRMYLIETKDTVYDKLSQVQKQILCCIYTRSCNGFIRDKYVQKLLDMPLEQWAMPYIVKLCDEYVVEILETIYNNLKDRDNTDIQRFCLANKESISKSYSRMVSYWNEYYREQVWSIDKYIGRSLFRECLGYNRTFDKQN